MELIAELIRITLEEAYDHCLIDWYIDEDAPETFDAECEIAYSGPSQVWPVPGDYCIILNDALMCLVNAGSLTCWHSSKLAECEPA